MDSDYGLDYMIEIFKNGFSTGNIFFIQLKGTDKSQDQKFRIKYQIKIKHLEYYNSIPNPILFLIYSATSDKFWGIWSNSLKDTLTNSQLNQDSVNLTLQSSNIIKDSFFEHLNESFTLALPKKISIDFIINEQSHEMCLNHLRNWVNKYFNNSVISNSISSPHSIKIKSTIEENGETIKIEYLSKEFSSRFFNSLNQIKFQLPVTTFEEVPDEFNDILIYLGLILMKWDIKNSLKLITICLPKHNGNLLKTENIYSLFERAKNENCILDYQEFIKATLRNNRWDIFEQAQLSLLFQSEYKVFYDDNLKLAINLVEDNERVGMFCYNLANSLLGKNLLYEANLYYHKARKLRPIYKELHYWWIEYGEVLFFSKHFKFAESFYRRGAKGINIKDVIPYINGYIGDALFFQSKFREAEIEFRKYILLNPKPNIFHIRLKVCEFLKEIDFNIKHGSSNSLNKKLGKLFRRKEKQLPDNILLNPLSGLHWFNYGVSLLNKDKDNQALKAFLVVVAIHENDKEAWRNCFLLAFNLKKDHDSIVILKAGITKFGMGFINVIAQSILENEEIASEDKQKAINQIMKIAEMINDE